MALRAFIYSVVIKEKRCFLWANLESTRFFLHLVFHLEVEQTKTEDGRQGEATKNDLVGAHYDAYHAVVEDYDDDEEEEEVDDDDDSDGYLQSCQ